MAPAEMGSPFRMQTAIAIASSVLGRPAMAIPAAIYSLIMFATAGIFGYWVSRSPEPVGGEPSPVPQRS